MFFFVISFVYIFSYSVISVVLNDGIFSEKKAGQRKINLQRTLIPSLIDLTRPQQLTDYLSI